MHYLGLLTAFIGYALAAQRTTAPRGALSVGAKEKYTTIQAAVDALNKDTTAAQSIFITPGTYHEQVHIPESKGPITIFGYTTDTTSYSSNQVTITQNRSQKTVANNDLTATLRVWTKNFKLYNINLVNSFGKGSQALALSAYVQDGGYYGCQFKGYQDTVLAQQGAQLYANSYIEGVTDFIFGQRGQAWFENCDIRVLAASTGYITASGRNATDPRSVDSWYVINQGTIDAAPGQNVPKGAFYLGRPWASSARVAFQNVYMTNVINPAGWTVWSKTSPNTDNVVFGEFGNTGEGSKGTRASFSTKLSKPVAIADVLGKGYESAAYVDAAYL